MNTKNASKAKNAGSVKEVKIPINFLISKKAKTAKLPK